VKFGTGMGMKIGAAAGFPVEETGVVGAGGGMVVCVVDQEEADGEGAVVVEVV